MTRALTRVFYVLTVAVLLFGCAATKAVVKACAPPLTDETQAITDLFNRPDLTTAEKIATAEAGKIALCVVTEIARDVVDRAGTLAFSTPRTFTGGMLEAPPMVAVSNAWIAKHP